MFCPRCSAQNKEEQKFCRQCGLSLSSVRLALSGKVDEATAAISKNVDRIAGGALTLSIFALVALASSFISGFSAAINLTLGLLIAGPMIYRGLKQAGRTIKLLDPKEQPSEKIKELPVSPTPEQPSNSAAALASVPDTDRMMSTLPPASIAEQTTLNLKQPNSKS